MERFASAHQCALVVTFGYTLKESMYFPDYGSDFILHETEDVLKALNGLPSGFADMDCDWDRLRRDADYFHDGKNADRLSEVISNALEESRTDNSLQKPV